LIRIRIFTAGKVTAAAVGRHTAGVVHQRSDLAPVEGHLYHLSRVDGLLVGDVLGLKRKTVGPHLDRRGLAPHRHRDVDGDIAPDLKHVVGPDVGLETLGGDGDVIGSYGDVGEDIDAAVIRLGAAPDAGELFHDGYGGIRNHGAGRVGDDSLDGARSSDLRAETGRHGNEE